MTLDSNIIIYSSRPEYPGLRKWIEANSPSVSAASVVEVLGYHQITPSDKTHFEQFFASSDILPIDSAVIDRAVAIRQSRKMSLGDALIAATALIFQRQLQTRNLKDFMAIPGLSVNDPLAHGDPA